MGWSFRVWWKKNKGRVNRARRARYESDPKYRDAILKAQREQDPKQKPAVEVVKMVPRKRSRYLKPKMVPVNGSVLEVRSLGVLADMLGVSDEAVKLWERDGVIPPATYVDSHGRRWYSDAYLSMLQTTPRVHPLSAWSKVLWEKYRGL